jgi:hypothetical protein
MLYEKFNNKIVLLGIPVIIFVVTAYNVGSEILTCIHWQTKAIALQAINGTPTEAWWTESPIMIGIQAWGQTAYNIISVLIGTALNLIHIGMKRRERKND